MQAVKTARLINAALLQLPPAKSCVNIYTRLRARQLRLGKQKVAAYLERLFLFLSSRTDGNGCYYYDDDYIANHLEDAAEVHRSEERLKQDLDVVHLLDCPSRASLTLGGLRCSRTAEVDREVAGDLAKVWEEQIYLDLFPPWEESNLVPGKTTASSEWHEIKDAYGKDVRYFCRGYVARQTCVPGATTGLLRRDGFLFSIGFHPAYSFRRSGVKESLREQWIATFSKSAHPISSGVIDATKSEYGPTAQIAPEREDTYVDVEVDMRKWCATRRKQDMASRGGVPYDDILESVSFTCEGEECQKSKKPVVHVREWVGLIYSGVGVNRCLHILRIRGLTCPHDRQHLRWRPSVNYPLSTVSASRYAGKTGKTPLTAAAKKRDREAGQKRKAVAKDKDAAASEALLASLGLKGNVGAKLPDEGGANEESGPKAKKRSKSSRVPPPSSEDDDEDAMVDRGIGTSTGSSGGRSGTTKGKGKKGGMRKG